MHGCQYVERDNRVAVAHARPRSGCDGVDAGSGRRCDSPLPEGRIGSDTLVAVTATLLRRLLLGTAVAVPVLLASPAVADVPEGWESQPENVDPLHALLVLGGIPLLLIVLITLAVYLPAMIRGERVAPGSQHELESHWFGGPRQGAAQLESGSAADDRAAVEARDSGGGSGRW